LRTQQEIKDFGLKCEDFTKNIAIIFEDDSVTNYNYAFFVENKEKYAIFTEHCGYFEYWKDSVKNIEEHNIFNVRLNFYKI
jgi:predicted nucleic-acid-binding Zn-ribbon protein